MFHAEQIEEWYFRDINVLGQVCIGKRATLYPEDVEN